jgi:uncharacterized protein (DUF58 family)
VRGRSLLAAGLACACSAVVLGEEDLVRVGVLLLVLPLAATAVLAGTRFRLRCTRTLEPRRVSVGALVCVTLQIENTARTPTPAMFAEDLVLPTEDGSLPDLAGWASTPRFALDRLEGGQIRTLRYPLRPLSRGRYDVGPLAVRLCDPFGFIELPRMLATVDRLLVTPEVVSLPRFDPVGTWAAGATTRDGGASGSGSDDVGTRPYRPGDEVRRVHWRTTARIGELSVRREEQPRQGSVTLLLDTRASAWPPAQEDEEPFWSSGGFETAVSVVASLAVALAGSGSGVRLATLDGAELAAVPAGRWSSSSEAGAVLEVLADVAIGTGSSTAAAAASTAGSTAASNGSRQHAANDVRIAVLGRLRPTDSELLTLAGSRPGFALFIGDGSGATALTAAGWRTQTIRNLSALPLAWKLLTAGAAAGRESLA